MSIAIIAIDSFDHTPYANPAVVASGVTHTRQALFFNITSRQASRQDRRVLGQTGAKYKAFSSSDTEPYQYLLLSDHPLSVPAGHPGYAARKQIAEQRYANWQMDLDSDGDNTSALEVLHFERLEDLGNRLQRRDMTFQKRRFRFRVTPSTATSELVYKNTNRRRYLFLPAASSASGVPKDFEPHVVVLKDVATYIKSAGAGYPRFAVGCTCRDWIFNSQNKTGAFGPAAYGCKHMLYYDLCKAKDDTTPDGIRVIRYI